MVKRLFSYVPMLDRKLLRDLWEMKGQSVAIASVIGAFFKCLGVGTFVQRILRDNRAAYRDSFHVPLIEKLDAIFPPYSVSVK